MVDSATVLPEDPTVSAGRAVGDLPNTANCSAAAPSNKANRMTITTVVAGRTSKILDALARPSHAGHSVGMLIFTAVVVPKPNSRDADWRSTQTLNSP